MVISVLATTIRLAFRYRKVIYKVLTAQDRAIGAAWRKGGYGRQAQYGARTGALVGTVVGAFIAPDTPGNNIELFPSKKQRPQFTSRKPNKTRNRFPTRTGTKRGSSSYSRRSERFACPSKYY